MSSRQSDFGDRILSVFTHLTIVMNSDAPDSSFPNLA